MTTPYVSARTIESVAPPPPLGSVAPPPPPGQQGNHPFETLPVGWRTATSPKDGRIYYWEEASGRTSWTHPLAIQQVQTQPIAPLPADDYPVDDYPQQRRFFWNTGDYGQQRRFFWNMGGLTRKEYHDTPLNATRRPDSQQCQAVTALVLCFPFGALAMYHSLSVDHSWELGKYGDAANHAKQASQYACFGNFVGACFWIWYLLIREGPPFDFRFWK